MQYTDIQEKFNKILQFSQNLSEINTDKLFSSWFLAKSKFINLFGGKLIYECPEEITVSISQEQKNIRLNNFFDNYVAAARYYNSDFVDFMEENREGIYENKVISSYKINGYNINKNMRLSKAITLFDNVPSYMIEAIRLEISKLIQEATMTGILCVSVHPLDFLSISENASNWRSCHSLDGANRSGNLSYMVDTHTVICYIKSKEDAEISRFPHDIKWNNKKWRALFFFDWYRHFLWAGRQYPLNLGQNVLDMCVDKLFKPTQLVLKDSSWEHKVFKEYTIHPTGLTIKMKSPCLPTEDSLVNLTDIIKDHPNSFHFNDLTRSKTYLPYLFKGRGKNIDLRKTGDILSLPPMMIGEEASCICCGRDAINFGSAMLCKDCLVNKTNIDNESVVYCSECGRRIYVDDAHWKWSSPKDGYGNYPYCDDCASFIED